MLVIAKFILCSIGLHISLFFDVAGATTFTRTDKKLYVSLVILLI